MIAIRKRDVDGEEYLATPDGEMIQIIEESALAAARAVCEFDRRLAAVDAHQNGGNPAHYCHKNEAIKMVRELAGITLHEAKAFYECETGFADASLRPARPLAV